MSTPTALYRMFGEDALLYIGISGVFPRRWDQHWKGKEWWTDVRRATLEWFPDEESAIEAEKAAILAEQPKYNVTHLKPARTPRERQPVVAPVQRGIAKLDSRDDDDDLLTLYEAGEITRLGPSLLDQAAAEADGPNGFALAGRPVFRRREIRQWIADVEASQRQASA